MSGLEVAQSYSELASLVLKAAKYIKEFIDGGRKYHERVVELESKLKTLRSVLKLFGGAARKVQNSSGLLKQQDEEEALDVIIDNYVNSRDTLKELFSCWGKKLVTDETRTLKLAVKYWCSGEDSKSIIERGMKLIDDRVQSMEIALHCLHTHLLVDIRDTVSGESPPLSRKGTGMSDSPSMEGYKLRHSSTGISTLSSFSDSKTLCGSDEWDLESFLNENPVSASNASGLSRTMIFAIQKKDKSTVRKLLESGLDPLTGDHDGWCALHHTVRADSKRVMRELFDSSKLKGNPKGLNQKDKNGATALQYAASIGRKSMVKELLSAGTDKDAVDNHGRSPLFMALEGNHVEIVELLLDHKVKVTPQLPPRFKEMQNAIIFRKRMEAKKKKH
jgi:hypothetical protein